MENRELLKELGWSDELIRAIEEGAARQVSVASVGNVEFSPGVPGAITSTHVDMLRIYRQGFTSAILVNSGQR